MQWFLQNDEQISRAGHGKRISNNVESLNTATHHKKLLEALPEASAAAIHEVKCECCGLKEECTKAYIRQIKRSHSGNWVCGLCSEAVKETINRCPETALKEAVSSHREFCQKYNSTTRLNPKLSFTCDMRDIAKRSCQSRVDPNGSAISKLGRSTSCVPRIDLSQY